MTYEALAAEVLSCPGPVRLVAVDGHGGAGKTTFAARLSRRAGGAPVVHTDDFASWEEPLRWWPRLLAQVIEPLAAGDEGRFQRYDWVQRRLANWVTVSRDPIVIIEGVSAGRREWSGHLAYTVFVRTPEEVRVRRALERDGEDMVDQWRSWIAAEEAHFAGDAVLERAALVVDGRPSVDVSAEDEFVVVRRRRSP